MSDQFDVTVVVAVKNGERFLGEALQSIRAQRHVAVELVVVDGRSTDKSVQIANQYDAKVVEESAPGLANAWNTGIGCASAPLVAFLDSDDHWVDDTLSARLQQLRGSAATISFGRVKHFRETDSSDAFSAKADRLLHEHAAQIPGTMLLRREVFSEVGLFNPEFKIAADADWLARALARKVVFCEFDGLVLMKRLHSTNLTAGVDETQSELLTVLRRKVNSDRSSST